MKRAITTTLVIAAILSGCGNDPGANVARACGAIVGGSEVEGVSPVVKLPGCSGVLIAPDVMLTAAHCEANARLVISDHYATVDEFIPHPDYDFPDNDIAIAFLSNPLDGFPVAPIGSVELGEATAIGYGEDELGDRGHREATVYVEKVGKRVETAPGPGGCFGDSGGGLFVGGELVGILAGVIGEDCGNGAVYTPVSDHAEWIERVAGIGRSGC